MEVFQNRSDAIGGSITSGATSIVLLSHTSAGDDGGGVYRQVGSNPGHAASFQNTAAGTWWELADAVANPQQFGAKGDGVTNDTAAIQGVINAWPAVFFPARTYVTNSVITVPTTCLRIEATGATMVGPGKTSGVDGFKFEGFHQGPDAGLMAGIKGQGYRIPALVGYRRALSIRNSAWLVIDLDLIKDSVSGIHVEATADAPGGDRRFCVQNRIFVSSMIRNCEAAYDFVCSDASDQGIQGNYIGCTYVSGCGYGIRGSFSGPTADFYFNEFYIGNLDGNGDGSYPTTFGVVYNLVLNFGQNKYEFPQDAINMNGTPTPYINVGEGQIIENGLFESNSFEPYNWASFLPGGARTTTRPGYGTLYIQVNPSAGAGGHGSSASPYNTITGALEKVKQLDGFGTTVVINLASATYTEQVTIDGRYANLGNMRVIIRSASLTASDVLLNGGFEVLGPINVLFEAVTFGCQSRTSLMVHDGATAQLVNHRFVSGGGQLHTYAYNGGVIEHLTGYALAGGAGAHARARCGGRLRWLTGTVALSGSPGFGNFVDVQDSGSSATFETGVSFSGSASGQRYSVAVNGSITTGGAGASYLPGTTAGASGLGGVYY